MPTGGGDTGPGSFSYLAAASQANLPNDNIGGAKAQELPYKFYSAGDVNDGRFTDDSGIGRWWSRVASNLNRAYVLYVNANYVYPATDYFRYVGFSLRCITTPTS